LLWRELGTGSAGPLSASTDGRADCSIAVPEGRPKRRPRSTPRCASGRTTLICLAVTRRAPRPSSIASHNTGRGRTPVQYLRPAPAISMSTATGSKDRLIVVL